MNRLTPPRLAALILLACALRAVPAAAGFPDVTDAERSLKSVAGEPNAPAVTLFKNAEFWMMDIARGEAFSRLVVRTRIKILTEEGKDQGEVTIPHSGDVRLSGFQGRTVLPDGKVVSVPADAKFKRKMSRQEKRFVTSLAFPAVEVGAILDYEYELRFDSFFLLVPWYYSDETPVLHSEIVYHIPPQIAARVWNRDPLKVGIQTKSDQTKLGLIFHTWADKLPAIRSEPFDVPFTDLATQIMMIPTVYEDGLQHTRLMEDWGATSELMQRSYLDSRRNVGAAKGKAKELAAAAGPSPRAKAAAIYRFVRDDVETEDDDGVFTAGADSSPDSVLARHRGNYAEKGLLLEIMLDAAKLDPHMVWASDRGDGVPDLSMANPQWFQKILVAVQLDGARVFLDPTDRNLAMGQLQPGYEGSAAVLPDRKKPETITLPQPTFDQNRREATIDLTLDGSGALAGTGHLAFAGQHAWERIGWKGDSATPEEAWKKYLEDEFEGYRVADVKIEEKAEERHVDVNWSMKQREEDALGDEATMKPSRPFGPTTQPFVLATASRRSPVLFNFADRDDLVLTLHWPAGWKVESRPKEAAHASAAGALAVSVAVDEPGRSLTYKRRLDITRKTFDSKPLFEAVRTLFAETEKSDGQPLVLVHH